MQTLTAIHKVHQAKGTGGDLALSYICAMIVGMTKTGKNQYLK